MRDLKAVTRRLLWIDLEMTGLDPQTDEILELALLVTDTELNLLAELGPIAIRQPHVTFESMNRWCQKMHTKTGLWERSQNSDWDLASTEAKALEFAQQWMLPETSPACGNTVFHDRRFLRKFMPKLDEFFHYRCLDVSTIKELVRFWNPQLLQMWKKPHPHQALEDIRNSVEELKFYREYFFKHSEPLPVHETLAFPEKII